MQWADAKRRMLDRRLMVLLRPLSIRLIQKLLLLQVCFRGLDYILLPDGNPPIASLLIVEQALPLDVWGWGFVGWGLIAYLGMWWKSSPLAAIGHMAIASIYGVFAAGALVEIIVRDGEFFGWRTGTGWVVAAAAHVIFALESERTWRIARGT